MSESAVQISVRPRTASDLPAVEEVLTRVHELTSYPVDGPSCFAKFLNPPSALVNLVALYEESIVGHVTLKTESVLKPLVAEVMSQDDDLSNYALVARFFVDPNLQGRGVGTRLMQEVVEYGKTMGKKLMLVVLEKDQAAIRIYERLGWKRGAEYFYESISGAKYRTWAYKAPMP